MKTFPSGVKIRGRNFFLGLALVFFVWPALNAQDFEWATLAGGPDSDRAMRIASDASSFIYVVGSFRGQAHFGSQTITSKGDSDIFLARYRTDGNLDWVKSMGGPGPDDGFGVATDGAGTVCITGDFVQTADFGGVSLTSFGGRDIFVACYSIQGMLKWARQAGGTSNFSGSTWADYGTDVAIGRDGAVYVSGEFQATANFGGLTLTSNGFSDAFLAKYGGDGSIAWAKRIGGSSADDGRALTIDSSGDVILTGLFTHSANFGPVTLTSAGSWDIYVSKWNPSGSVIWAKRAGGPDSDRGVGVTADPDGNVYVTGYFRSTADFGSQTLTATGERDAFVLKMSPGGSFIWTLGGHGQGPTYGSEVLYGATGHVYVTGSFSGNATFDGLAIRSSGHQDIFVAQLDPGGSFDWIKSAGSEGDDHGVGVVLNGPRLLVSGEAGVQSTFDSMSPVSHGLTDAFVASIDLRPHAPALVAPEQDAAGVSTSANIVWTVVDLATRFDVQVAADREFVNLVYTENTPKTSVAFVAPVADHTYYWRTRGVGLVGPGEWSEVHNFSVGSSGPMAAHLLSPANNAQGVATTPVLTWLAAPEATWHHMQVSTGEDFSAPELDIDHVMGTTYLAMNLNHEVRYYWRVAGVNETGKSTFSTTWSFVTMMAVPGEVILQSPETGSEGVSAYAAFDWQGLAGADRYHLQVATDATFSTLVVDDSTLTVSQFTTTSPLTYAATYHWRVRAHNVAGFGSWCPPSTFVVAIGTAVEQSGEVPTEFYLDEPYPNPFNPSTRIEFGLPEAALVELAVFDVRGRLVASLTKGTLPPGQHSVDWRPNSTGSGLYFVRLRTPDRMFTQVVLLAK